VPLFCVLEPRLNKPSYTRKVAKTRELPILANNMHEFQLAEK
jgi:hypothetical protein